MDRVISRVGITPVGSPRYRVNRLRFHLLAYVISEKACLEGNEGVFLVRCDDTNEENTDISYLDAYLRTLKYLGVDPDEGPHGTDREGESFFQSRRKVLYESALKKLTRDGYTFEDGFGATYFDAEAFYNRHQDKLDGFSLAVRDLSFGVIKADIRSSLNRVDSRRGLMPFPLSRADGHHLFNLCSPVDDGHMGVTHVVRDMDKLNVLSKQEMVRIALGLPEVCYLHLPLLVKADGTRFISDDKYHDATIESFLEAGIMSDAVVSYLLASTFGAPEQYYPSIYSFAERVVFSKMHKKPTVFNPSQIWQHNKMAVRNSSREKYLAELHNYLNYRSPREKEIVFGECGLAESVNKNRRDFATIASLSADMNRADYGAVIKIPLSEVRSVLDFVEQATKTAGSSIDYMALLVEAERRNAKKLLMDLNHYRHALRYIMTGSDRGFPLGYVVKYLSSKKLIKQRLAKAREMIFE